MKYSILYLHKCKGCPARKECKREFLKITICERGYYRCKRPDKGMMLLVEAFLMFYIGGIVMEAVNKEPKKKKRRS